MRDPTERAERSLLKIALWLTAIVVTIVALSIGGHRYYRDWQQRRLIGQADEFFQKGDYKRASLNARRVIQLNEGNIDAARMMARLAEKAGLRSAVDWRRRVLDLAGARGEDALALARVALRFDEIGSAEFAIGKMSDAEKNTADFHAIAADLATARRDTAETARQLSEAVRLAPENKEYALRLASIHLRSSDLSDNEKGRTELLGLQKDASVGRDATRHLIADALRRYDHSAAIALAQELQRYPDVTFRDRIVALDALHTAGAGDFSGLLETLQRDSVQKPENLADLLSWMTANRMAPAAIEWSKTLAPDVLSKRPVPLALSDAFITAGDWEGLQRLVKSAAWGDLDFLRAALHARALRELGSQLDSQSQWNAAVKKASAKPEALLTLAETAERWGWNDEAIDLLWLAAKDPLKGEAALQTLYTYFSKKNDTQNLYRVLLHLEELRPEDRNVRNNVAQLSLLLNMNVDRAQKLARELYEAEPSNAAYASTFAFALYTQGNGKKAAAVLGALSEEKLKQPAVAAYYALVLVAAGQTDRAEEFVKLAEAARLLPEEQTLLDKVRRALPAE